MPAKTKLAISAAIVLGMISAAVAKEHVPHAANVKHRVHRLVPANAFDATVPRPGNPAGGAGGVLNDYPHVFCCS